LAVTACLSIFGYGALPSEKDKARVVVSTYCKVLAQEPIWAVEKACEWYQANGDRGEAPMPKDILWRTKMEKGWFDGIRVSNQQGLLGIVWVGTIYSELKDWLEETKNA